MVDINLVKQLRQETDVSISECQKALEEAKGDVNLAKEILRKWGKNLAGKKSEREAKQGVIESYIHANKKIGVLLFFPNVIFILLHDNLKITFERSRG